MTPALEASKKQFGGCSIAFEPPDIVHTTSGGELTTAQVTAMFEEFHRLGARPAPRFSLVGLGELKMTSMEVRKLAIAKSGDLAPASSTAVYGGSSRMRMILSMFMRALVILVPRYSDCPMRFFETEAEARAWLADQRRRGAGAP